MKKYFFIYKTTIMENLQYTINLLFGILGYFLISFVFLNLWKYIYSDPSQVIEGYTMTQMVWYVILTEMMWFSNNNGTLRRQISQDIKSGGIAYGLNKPYNYLNFMISKHFGEITIRLGIYLTVGILTGYMFVGKLPNFKIENLPYMVIVFFLGMLINSIIRMIISNFSFWIEDAIPFHWLYDKLILVIGTIFPVEMFPKALQPIIKCSPIYVVNYGPTKVIIDFSIDMFFNVLMAQLIYIGGTVLLLSFFFQKGVKKLNVNGG